MGGLDVIRRGPEGQEVLVARGQPLVASRPGRGGVRPTLGNLSSPCRGTTRSVVILLLVSGLQPGNEIGNYSIQLTARRRPGCIFWRGLLGSAHGKNFARSNSLTKNDCCDCLVPGGRRPIARGIPCDPSLQPGCPRCAGPRFFCEYFSAHSLRAGGVEYPPPFSRHEQHSYRRLT